MNGTKTVAFCFVFYICFCLYEFVSCAFTCECACALAFAFSSLAELPLCLGIIEEFGFRATLSLRGIPFNNTSRTAPSACMPTTDDMLQKIVTENTELGPSLFGLFFFPFPNKCQKNGNIGNYGLHFSAALLNFQKIIKFLVRLFRKQKKVEKFDNTQVDKHGPPKGGISFAFCRVALLLLEGHSFSRLRFFF